MTLLRFFKYTFSQIFRGPLAYWLWLGLLACGVMFGAWHSYSQLRHGLIVTNMSDQVAWGFYIANFTFLVGVAAAAVMLAIPAYIFERQDIKDVVLMGDTMAVTAVIMAMLFIMVDLGRPDRIWHLIPGIGRFNFPISMLAWDVVVLFGYLVLNVGISFYILFSHSAFASGPALMIIGFQIIRRAIGYPVPQSVISLLAIIMAVALQITLFFIGTEIFTEFYNEGANAASFRYLFLGLDGSAALQPWIWAALAMLVVAVTILMIHPLRKSMVLLNVACVLTVAGVWIEKGMGLVIPGSVPTPMGEVLEYLPNMTEVSISIGVWSMGLMIITLLMKAAAPIECHMIESRCLPEKEPP
jgi:molybdopterin-containing oxidoreductase family membrane subunit